MSIKYSPTTVVGTWQSCGCFTCKLSNVKRAGSPPAATFAPVCCKCLLKNQQLRLSCAPIWLFLSKSVRAAFNILVSGLSVYFGESLLYFYSVACKNAYLKKNPQKFLCRIIQSTVDLCYSCSLGELCNCDGRAFNKKKKKKVEALLVNLWTHNF